MRYDALLTRHLAAELNARFSGKPVHGVELQPDTQRLIIDVDDTRLHWNLHPGSGHLGRIVSVLPLDQPVQLPRKAHWKRASALFDERVLIIELSGAARPHVTMQIVVELLTNQWNAITLDADGKLLRQLKVRSSSARELRRGQPYVPPQAEPRATASLSEWQEMFGRVEPGEWKPFFLRRFAYASPLNADAVFAANLEDAYARYQELLRESRPHIVQIQDTRQPYSHSLWSRDAQAAESLLAAMESVGGADVSEDVAEEIARRLYAVEKKVERLNQELATIGTRATATRLHADLLMAYATTITRGVRKVTLPDFEGTNREIELDPALSPIENAQELYQEAKKQQRASERIPKLIALAQRSREQLLVLNERAQRGELTPKDVSSLIRKPPSQKQRSVASEKLPYRRYKTSGGLEVRVGRNSRANDELTLHHASPRDIWLHARHVGGAHVVLRWDQVEANPSARDLYEAAVLAAFHSQARTSRTVPVDYTRRKYVIKKRKSPAGQVLVERAKTLFVEPSSALEEQLRWVEEE
ncbi:MAG TPA: NFACT RNA binding domain-containing protein [Longimicrobiales bacterium]